jgi:hypothetical protein
MCAGDRKKNRDTKPPLCGDFFVHARMENCARMTELNNTGGHPPTTTAPLSEGAARPSQSPPEFFRLPKAGGDPYFGLGRSYYYQGEQLGYWRLVRLRKRGKLRGVTLVPYDAVADFIRNQGRTAA